MTYTTPADAMATHTPSDAAVAAAMDGLRGSGHGWSALSASLARYLLAQKGANPARLWVESVFSNLTKGSKE